MTYENCKKYMEEAKDEETRQFWADRIKRKYGTLEEVEEVVEPVEEVEEKPKAKKKKEVKE